MTTPKELADKAKRYARCARHGSATYEAKTLLELNATIDQLQAMAEARQGSGEVVALREVGLTRDVNGMCVVTVNGREAIRDNGDVISHFATLDWFAPPSARQATNPTMTREELVAAAESIGMRFPQQQATGSGQVLTDVQIMGIAFDERFLDGPDYIISVVRKALAAATQAQPESREQRLATAMKRFDEHGPLPGMISAFEQQFGQTWTDREWRQEANIWSAAWRAALAAPPSAQQAAGSGQVLTDEVERLTSALRNMRSNAAPRALSWTWADCKVASEAADMLDRLRDMAASGAKDAVAPTVEAAHQMGATGGPTVEAERLAFEAWMRGHCWALSAKWTGTQYRSDAEEGGHLDPLAMATRRLWAAWRDRAALAATKRGVA